MCQLNKEVLITNIHSRKTSRSAKLLNIKTSQVSKSIHVETMNRQVNRFQINPIELKGSRIIGAELMNENKLNEFKLFT